MKTNLLRPSYFNSFSLTTLTVVLVFSLFTLNIQAQTSNGLNFNNSTIADYFNTIGYGNYATIDGVNLITQDSYTKEAWIRISDASGPGTNARNIITETNSAFFVYDDGSLAAGQKPSYTARVKDPTPLVVGTWYHVAVTFDASTNEMILYKNGVAVANVTTAAMAMGAGDLAPTNIGAIYYTAKYGFGFVGDIAEVRIWGYARSAEEIALTKDCSLPIPTDGLLAYYKFDEGDPGNDNTSITELTDASGNGNDATLHGFDLDGSSSNFIDEFDEVKDECSVVPVTLTYFNSKVENGSVVLSWQTALEMNNKGFSVQRSADGNNNWQSIGFVNGNGTTNNVSDYQLRDQNPLAGKNYYRLVQTDLDGRITLSKVVSATISDLARVALFPTVATTSVRVNVSDKLLLRAPFGIFDNTGRLVNKGLIQSFNQDIDVSNLQNGVYFLKVQGAETVRFVKK